jgi:cytochrome c oxidase subunit IV
MSDVHLSLKSYFGIYALLLVGLAVTVAVAYVPLGEANVFVAMLIAIAKATLVVLYFMHVATSPRLNRIVIGAALVWLSILLVVILSDYLTRDWIPTRAPAHLALEPDDESFQPPREGSGFETQDVPHAAD